MGVLLLTILASILLMGVSIKGYGGLAMNLWVIVGLAAVLWGFGHTSWEGWILLAMVNVGGILVLMIYASSTDGYNKIITDPKILSVGFFAILYLYGVSSLEPTLTPKTLVYTGGSGVLLLLSGVFLVLVMIACNRMLGAGGGYLREFSCHS
uniref:NADH dehydrogenase subunit 6 n=1 Tax=Pomphorhynchus sp. TP-2012 TaxID=1184605 RepID=A0A806GMH5_9BILA|nr:NADH dehydrogenase subunit 6 [Pomphorhynchus sp. TP-2012]